MLKSILAGVIGIAIAASVPAAAQEQHYQGDICGNRADIVLKTPSGDANAQLKQFFGVWGKGTWSNRMCTGLAVTEVNGNTATVQYFYGAGTPPDPAVPGSFVKTDAVMKGKWLYFHSLRGYEVIYELKDGQLKGWFGNLSTNANLRKLQ